MKFKKHIILFTLFTMNLVEQPTPEIRIEQGVLKGKISADGTYYEYLGIPYASFNRETRFKAPSPPPNWDGVYNAVDEMYKCPQLSMINTVIGSEDCLRVNIYAPVKAKKPLPVMVFIHGGSFSYGDGGKFVYGPDFLIKNDIILVTFNYRLGNIGFICLGIEEAPGNAGLKDQLAALRWIKDNIAAFGGDPDNITLFGESAGAASISIFLATGKADGLYHKAILQSGSAMTAWAMNREPVKLASVLPKSLGYDTEDPHDIYEVISKLTTEELAAIKPVKELNNFIDSDLIHFTPCIEKAFSGSEAVITDLPYDTYKTNNIKIPVMTGINSKESLYSIYYDNKYVTRDEKDGASYWLTSDLEFKDDQETMNASMKVKEFYFGDKDFRNNSDILVNLYSDLFYKVPSALETDILLTSNISVYNYWFDYNGNRNFAKYLSGSSDKSGACHSDDIFYIFSSSIWPFKANSRDAKVIETISRLWTNFAKYSDPTPAFDHTIPFRWTPSEKSNLKYLYIDEVSRMGPMPELESYELWKEIYDKNRRLNLSLYFN